MLQIYAYRKARILPCLLPEIAQARAEGKRVLLLVPGQYTLQAEREVVEGLHLSGLMDIDVLSPQKLAAQVRERAGGLPLRSLGERGRVMAFSAVLTACRAELDFYRSSAGTYGLAEEVSRQVAELQRSGLTPAQLRLHAGQTISHGTQLKWTDLALIWERYLELIGGRFADETMTERETVLRLPRSGLADEAAVFACGFDALQPYHRALLLAMCASAEKVTVAMCMDRSDVPDAAVFRAQRSCVSELLKEAKDAGVAVSVRYQESTDERAEALRYFTAHLFDPIAKPFTGRADGIRLYRAANPAAEAMQCAAILREWHERGTPWDRMTVAYAETSVLPGALSEALRACSIPHFLSVGMPMARHGLCRLLIASLRAVCLGYGAEDMQTALCSGFAPLTEEEQNLLRVYASENGIQGRKWLEPFSRGEDAAAMEPLRLRLTEPMAALHTALLEAKTATASVTAIYDYLVAIGAYGRLMEREEALLRRGMQTEAQQNRQVWRALMELLDQLHALLGSRRAAMRDLSRLVENGLKGQKLSTLPNTAGCVMVGEAGHSLVGDVDGLILMGLQDSATLSAQEGLLSEEERSELGSRSGLRIGLTQQEQRALRLNDFFRAATCPDREIVLTYSASDTAGKALRPSSLVGAVRRVFPMLRCGEASGEGLLSPAVALDSLALRLRRWLDGSEDAPGEEWQAAAHALLSSPLYQEKTLQVLDGLTGAKPEEQLTPQEAESVYQQSSASISRIERYAACPYSYFVRYGLRPAERREFVYQADERGIFFHAVMQRYAELASAYREWPNLPDEEIEAIVTDAVEEQKTAWKDGPLEEDEVGRRLGREYERMVRRGAWLFTRHARQGHFSAAQAEVRFGPGGTLPPLMLRLSDGRTVALQGVIDRIDRFRGDKGVYLRVVDYKSSTRELEAVRIAHGLQLQLLLYLRAALAASKGEKPAGCFYFFIRDPHVNTEEDIREAAEKALARELRLSGVVLAETEVVTAMNGDDPDSVIPKVLKKDGTPTATAMACTEREMGHLLAEAERIAAAVAEEMRSGFIPVSPVRLPGSLACEQCSYGGICGRDPQRRGFTDRDLTGEDENETWNRLVGRMAAEK